MDRCAALDPAAVRPDRGFDVNRLAYLLFLALLALGLVACPTGRRGGGGGGGSDDDDAGEDDDDAGQDDDDAGQDDDDAGPDGPEDDLPCDGSVIDIWTVTASSGDSITARVDTVAADTAFDPAVGIFEGSLEEPIAIAEGDDEFECTFPPLDYMCPEASGTAEVGGTILIVVNNLGSCVGAIGEYVVEVTVDGAPTTPSLDQDDFATAG